MRWRWLLLPLLALVPLAGLAFGRLGQDAVARTAEPYRFDALLWESRALPPALLLTLTPWRQPSPGQRATNARIDAYFAVARQAAVTRQSLERLAASEPDSPGRATLEVGVADQEATRAALADEATRALQAQLEAVIAAEGLGPSLPGWPSLPLAWPPARFVLETPPRVLVVSPRHRIVLERQVALRPSLMLAEAEALEVSIEAQGLSALVEELGGYASYPATVPTGYSLETTLGLVAHEWVHHYLTFRPLGWAYERGPPLRSANETLADLVGDELAQAVLRRYHGRARAETERPSAADAEPGRFDFGAFMRGTRLQADALLVAGEVVEAEAYMEAQRQVLLGHGYSIRRLNQAYFAFHGTYATGPVSVDPLGGRLRALRARSRDLGAFLLTVSAVGTEAQLEALLPPP